MKTSTTYCARCNRNVPVAFTAAPAHQGHATLPDGPELVCLGMNESCEAATACCLTNLSPVVMRARLGACDERGPTRGRIRGREARGSARNELIWKLIASGYTSVPGVERETGIGSLR